MTCSNCDECTAWNPFHWIDDGKVCGGFQGPYTKEWDEIIVIWDSIDCDKKEEPQVWTSEHTSKAKEKADWVGRSARDIRSELGWRDLTEAERDANLEYNMKEIECPTTSLGDSDHHTQNKKSS